MSDGGDPASASREPCSEAAWYMGELGFELKPSLFLAVHLGVTHLTSLSLQWHMRLCRPLRQCW